MCVGVPPFIHSDIVYERGGMEGHVRLLQVSPLDAFSVDSLPCHADIELVLVVHEDDADVQFQVLLNQLSELTGPLKAPRASGARFLVAPAGGNYPGRMFTFDISKVKQKEPNHNNADTHQHR